jgi:bacterial/archaeal transporter family-2 protein
LRQSRPVGQHGHPEALGGEDIRELELSRQPPGGQLRFSRWQPGSASKEHGMSHLLELLALAVLAIGAGVSFVVQQAVNANLRAAVDSAAWAGFVSYLGGTLCMLVLALILRDVVPSVTAVARSNWMAWTGGFFGAVYIAISILLLPRLGAATFVALLVAGQMLASLAFDHYGLLGLAQQPVTPPRLLGAAFLIGGVILVRL